MFPIKISSVPPLPYIPAILLHFVDFVKKTGSQKMMMIAQIVRTRRYIWLLLWILYSPKRPVFHYLPCIFIVLCNCGQSEVTLSS